MINKKKFTIEITVDEDKLSSWNYHDQEDVEWLRGEMNSGGLINFLNELIEEGEGTDIILHVDSVKSKSVDIKNVKKGIKVRTLKFIGKVTTFDEEGCYIDVGDDYELREEWVNFEDIIELEE